MDKDPTRAKALLATLTLRTPQYALLLSRASHLAATREIRLPGNVIGLLLDASTSAVAAITSNGVLASIDIEAESFHALDHDLRGPATNIGNGWLYARRRAKTSTVTITETTTPPRMIDAGDLDATASRGDHMPEQFAFASIDRLDDGIYYIDLSRATMTSIDAVIARLATAPGVIFDLRGYTNANRKVLSYLLTRDDDSKPWMAVPRVIRPDHASTSIPAWERDGWAMPVLEPHIGGRVAFLSGPAAVSSAESVLELVEYYHLGEIVGSVTAGTSGNVAEVTGPTGCRTRFTGMRVTRHDGSRQHLLGVQPTIPASRTVAGVAAGRDEVLERALAYVRGAAM